LKDSEPYDACPYCLTQAIPMGVSVAVEKEPQLEVDKMAPKVEALSPTDDVRAKVSPKKVQGCSRHFGYLSERSPKEKIPDNCMTCENIVQCMLKAVTG
jgi:hypothetical protein